MKFGAQNTWGFLEQGTTLNAALGQIYQNGVPTSAAIYNTPERDKFTMNAQWGLYAQDAWTMKRMTVNYGLRWEYFHSSVAAESSTAGVYVPARTFGPEDMPIWKTLSPRFGVVYDLFGNAKTALKFSVNKYQLSATNGVAAALNPMRLQSASVTWRDLNGDNIVQGATGCTFNTPGCEINLAQLPRNFGLITPGCSTIATAGSVPCGTAQVDPNVQRPYEVMYNLGVQHELLPRVSLTANWVRTNFYALALTQNVLQSFSDYTPATIYNPINGSPITIYNVSAAKQAAVLNFNTTDPQGELAGSSRSRSRSTRADGASPSVARPPIARRRSSATGSRTESALLRSVPERDFLEHAVQAGGIDTAGVRPVVGCVVYHV
jgi:hypothetical protein